MEIINLNELRIGTDDYDQAQLDLVYGNICKLSKYVKGSYFNYAIWHYRYGDNQYA